MANLWRSGLYSNPYLNHGLYNPYNPYATSNSVAESLRRSRVLLGALGNPVINAPVTLAT